MNNRWVACIAAALTIGAALDGCKGTDCPVEAQPSFNCTSFQPGTDMSSADFGASESIEGQLSAYAQATGNLAVVAGDALTNVTAACRSMAIDLGDDPTGGTGTTDKAYGKSGTDLLDFWCQAAKQQLAVAAELAGQVMLSITPAKCSASIVDATSCQSRCASDAGACASTLATCAGGTIESTCTTGCAAGSAPYDCVGACAGQCSGACVGTSGTPVTCVGKCDGTCVAKLGLGDGPQADGTCKGTCSGTCTLTSETASCEGLCNGQCAGACSPIQPNGNAICSGKCLGSSEAIACVGGALGGGCATDSDCQANCNAAAQAAALCKPASVVVSISNPFPTGVAPTALVATVEKNFPALLLVIQGQGKAMATTMTDAIQGEQSLTASKDIDVLALVCITDMVEAATSANANFAEVLADANAVSAVIGGPSAN